MKSKNEQDSWKKIAEFQELNHHPNIIKPIGYYLSDSGKYFLTMEYSNGLTLQELVDENNGKIIPDETIIDYALQIVSGMKEIHALGISHKDLTCNNVVLHKEKGKIVLKIIDINQEGVRGYILIIFMLKYIYLKLNEIF